MKVIGIIAEFNPFHLGHSYLIDRCKKDLGADRVVVVMSGDFVQRGAPAIIDKFSRARMALESGADLVLELPIYYSLGSAEFFSRGAISVLNGLNTVDYLCFGSECADLETLRCIAKILETEPPLYKQTLEKELRLGNPFPASSAKALSCVLESSPDSVSDEECKRILDSPNCKLGIEYLKALKKSNSSIRPYTTLRIGQPYHSDEIGAISSATGIRKKLFSDQEEYIKSHVEELFSGLMPKSAIDGILSYKGEFMDSDSFSELLRYKLLLEKSSGFTKYLDVNTDISNLIAKNLEKFDTFDNFCLTLKNRNFVYTRISRCLFHILLNLTAVNMSQYSEDSFTSYARVLGLKAASSDLVSAIHDRASIPVIDRLKYADKLLTPLQMRLLDETLTASRIYNSISKRDSSSEYSRQTIII